MAYYVSHITPHKRARIHDGDCVRCRNGQGQENQQDWQMPFFVAAGRGTRREFACGMLWFLAQQPVKSNRVRRKRQMVRP